MEETYSESMIIRHRVLLRMVQIAIRESYYNAFETPEYKAAMALFEIVGQTEVRCGLYSKRTLLDGHYQEAA